MFKESLPESFTGHLVKTKGVHQDWDSMGHASGVFHVCGCDQSVRYEAQDVKYFIYL